MSQEATQSQTQRGQGTVDVLTGGWRETMLNPLNLFISVFVIGAAWLVWQSATSTNPEIRSCWSSSGVEGQYQWKSIADVRRAGGSCKSHDYFWDGK